jgi:exopolyphosphatase / guanosine-5'-triphosphate,3'-diphosphate pyrophosphatase
MIDAHSGAEWPRRCACIDVGTNSVKMLIADVTPERAYRVFENSVVTRLGEAMNLNDGKLSEGPMNRTLAALEQMRTELDKANPVFVRCVGTAALRNATNSEQFVAMVAERTGLTIEVIPGREEARLSYLAVALDSYWRRSTDLKVIDIGGGSTEIIVPATAEPPGSTTGISVSVGAVSLTERFNLNGIVDPELLRSARDYARLLFVEAEKTGGAALLSAHHGGTAAGVGGTLTTLAAISNGGNRDPAVVHGSEVTREQIESAIGRLASIEVPARQQIPGLDPRRADIILGGAIALTAALEAIECRAVRVSTRGLRWGVLYDKYFRLPSPNGESQ